jgi:hypothetical protein
VKNGAVSNYMQMKSKMERPNVAVRKRKYGLKKSFFEKEF